jgi:hypothetical protein
VSPVKQELDFCITEDDILHSHRRGNLKSYNKRMVAVSIGALILTTPGT